jgi:hypothetical protein
MTPKEEWLRFSGLDHSLEDIWLRDNIAALYDEVSPSPSQTKLLHMAGLRLSLMDLPANAYPGHKEELKALAWTEFGRLPAK